MVKPFTAFLVIAVAVVSLVVMAPAASADPNPPGCPREYFCAYSGVDQTGTLLFRTRGNWSGTVRGARSVFNNGVRWPGADHVYLLWYWPSVGVSELCLHYNPGPGHKQNLPPGSEIWRVRWGGEC